MRRTRRGHLREQPRVYHPCGTPGCRSRRYSTGSSDRQSSAPGGASFTVRARRTGREAPSRRGPGRKGGDRSSCRNLRDARKAHASSPQPALRRTAFPVLHHSSQRGQAGWRACLFQQRAPGDSPSEEPDADARPCSRAHRCRQRTARLQVRRNGLVPGGRPVVAEHIRPWR